MNTRDSLPSAVDRRNGASAAAIEEIRATIAYPEDLPARSRGLFGGPHAPGAVRERESESGYRVQRCTSCGRTGIPVEEFRCEWPDGLSTTEWHCAECVKSWQPQLRALRVVIGRVRKA